MPKGVFLQRARLCRRERPPRGGVRRAARDPARCAARRSAPCMRAQKVYRQIPFLQGSCEYSMPDVATDHPRLPHEHGHRHHPDTGDRFMYSGTSFYRAIPCDRSIVTDGEIHPYDDWEAIINSKENFALAACYCKTCAAYGDRPGRARLLHARRSTRGHARRLRPPAREPAWSWATRPTTLWRPARPGPSPRRRRWRATSATTPRPAS